MSTIIRIIFRAVHQFGLIELFFVFFIIINILTFLLYMLDKQKAVKSKRRIRESTLIFFTLVCGGIGAFLGFYFFKHKKNKLKFKISIGTGFIITLIPIIHMVHSLTLDEMIRYEEIEFFSENWPVELDGYRIAFMTDKHTITDEAMAEVVTELNGRNLDLLLLGGDFSSDVFRGGTFYQGTIREIAQTNTTDGIFGVDGNHDYYARLFHAKEQYGIIPLDNSGMYIREGFYLAGVQDLWRRNPNIADAIAGANTDDFILLLSHNPDVSMQQSTIGIDLILSGHTHGGQITFFGYPFYLLRGSISDYGTYFTHGFVRCSDEVSVFVSRGVGVYYAWPRIFARPEVIIFTMYSE